MVASAGSHNAEKETGLVERGPNSFLVSGCSTHLQHAASTPSHEGSFPKVVGQRESRLDPNYVTLIVSVANTVL